MGTALPSPVPGLEIERELGRGGNGVVYLATDRLLARQVALKVLPSDSGPPSEETSASVLAEARMVARLSSPNVVTLYRIHAGDAGWMLEMEYVGGGSLESRLRERGALPPDEAVRVLAGIGRGLAAAHSARIVHGDVKPANVLFAADGTPKLADFGIARILSAGAPPDGQARIAGTPYYMAPEVVRWQGAQLASDIWSLGVVAYELLSGHLPFESESYVELFRRIREDEPAPLPESVPPRFALLVARCLAKDPAARPATAGELVRELERMVAGDARLSQAIPPAPAPSNLTRPSASIVGRDAELRTVRDRILVRHARLVTLVGPGGVGKTRLAVEAALGLRDAAEGGAWFADLSEARSPEAAAQAVLHAFGLTPEGGRAPVMQVAEVLQSRPPLLLLLDNFEQLLEHAASTIGVWLREAPGTTFLVTSRAVLGLEGEHDLEVTPLPCGAGADLADGGDGAASPAVRLFVERAQEAEPRFALEAADIARIVRICRELDGLPLAIELAASRIRLMSPAQIEANLARKFELLATVRRDTTRRRSTLRGAIEWSFELLSGWERDAFLQACVFEDGFSLDSAEQVIDLSRHPDAPAAFDVVQALRDKSLLFVRDAGHESRLGMYRAIREFGVARGRTDLGDAEKAALRERHARQFAAFADAWNLGGGSRSPESLDRVGLETANLRAAHAYALERGDGALAARIALGAADSTAVRRPPAELVALMEATLAAGGAVPPDARAMLLVHLSTGCQKAGDWARAIAAADEAVEAARREGAARPLVAALLQSGSMCRERGDLDAALARWAESEELARKAGDQRSVAASIGNRGMVLFQRGEFARAEECYETAERIARAARDVQSAALQVGNRGVEFERQGDRSRALACYREAESLGRRIGDRVRVAVSLGNQANVLTQTGDWDAALTSYREAEAIARELGARQRIAQIVGNRAALHTIRGEIDEALACLREAESISRALGDRQRTALTLRQLASVLGRRGDVDAARASLLEAEEIARSLGDRELEARTICTRAMLSRDTGDRASARELFRTGLALYDATGGNRTVWYLGYLAAWAELTAAEGDVAESRRLAAAAVQLAASIGVTDAHPDPEKRRLLESCRRIAAS